MKYLAPLYVLALHVSKFSMALSTSVLMIVAVLPAVPAVVLSPSAILYNDTELTTEEPVALNLTVPALMSAVTAI